MSGPSPHEIQIAVFGTGAMGGPMAANLLRAGFPATVWNRTVGAVWLQMATVGTDWTRRLAVRRADQVDPLVAAASLQLSDDDVALIQDA